MIKYDLSILLNQWKRGTPSRIETLMQVSAEQYESGVEKIFDALAALVLIPSHLPSHSVLVALTSRSGRLRASFDCTLLRSVACITLSLSPNLSLVATCALNHHPQ